MRWLFWNKWRPWALLVIAALAITVLVRVATGAPARPASGHPSPASSAPSTAGPPRAAPATISAASSQAVESPVAAGTVNIYSWLPFTRQDLAAAAAVTVRFSVDYDTFTYADTAAAYVGAMNGLITDSLATTLQAAYSAPGVARLRTGQRQASTGTATIESLRAFGPSSITFNVTARQRIVSARGTTTGTTQYAVTVTGSGTSWQVNDIELSSAGNA